MAGNNVDYLLRLGADTSEFQKDIGNVLAEINKAGKNKINVTAEDQALAKSIKQQLKGIITSLKAGDQVDLSKLVNVQTLASQLKGTNDVIVGLRDSVALLGQSFKAISGFELGTNLENTMQNLNVMVEKLGVSIDKFIGKIDNMDGRISKLESAEKPFKQIEGAINSATSASDTSVKKIESNQAEINKSFNSTSEKAKELSDEMKKVNSDVVSDSASKGIEASAKNAEKMAIARIEKVRGYIKKHLPDADLDTGKFKELIDQYADPSLTKDDRSSVIKEVQDETAKALRLQKDVLIVDNNKIKAEEEILAVKKEQLAVDEKSLNNEVVKKQTTKPDVELEIVKTDESINEKSKDIIVSDEVVSSSKTVANAKKDEADVVKDLKTAIDDANKSAEESVKINSEAVKSSKSKKSENSFTYDEYNEKSSSLKNLSIDSLMKEYESVSDASIKQLSSGIVKFSANVKTAEGTWHKFSATVSKDSSLIEKNITDLNAKRASSLEKALSFEEGAGEKTKLYNADEVANLAKETESAINRVLTAANKYKVTVDSFGQVSISEIISKDGASSVDSFIAKFSSVSELLEKSKGDAEEFKKYFNSAFDVNSYSVGIDKTNKTISDSMKPLTLGNKEYSFMSKDIKSNLSDSLNAKFEEVADVSIKKAADGVVKFSSKVKDAEKTWKSLSGTISTSGSMIDTTVKDLTDAQSAKLNKSSQPSVGGVKYDSSQVAALAKETEAAIARLLSSANKYKIIVNSLGEVSISETIDAGGKSSETFVAKFSDVKELIDKSRGSVEEFEKYFKSAFSNNSYSIGVNTKESVDKLQFSFENVSKEVDRFAKKSGKVEQYYKAVNKINEAMAEWGALEKKRTTNGLEVDEIKRLTDLRKNIKEVMSIYSSKNYDVVNQKGMAVPDAPTLNGSNIVQTMKELAEMDAKSAIATSVLDEKNRSLTVTYKEIDGVVKKTTYSYDENINMIRKASVETGMYQSWSAKLGNTIKETIKTFGTLFSTYRIASGITQQFKNGITILKTYDEALTNMSYTMDLSKAKFKELGKFAIDMANDLDISIENSMDIYKIYANMTTTVEEINKTAVPTTYLANLTGQTTEQVSDQIQGIMQQFEMQAEQSEHIVDVLESVSSNVAIDNTKAIETMTSAIAASGQAAYDAGLSYEQLASLSAKMAERTREDGGSIGNAIKTMIVRISKASKLSGADEVDNATLSEASKSLHDVGVEVYNLDGSFRQMDVIITELNEKWDGLTDAQQSNIAYNVAATRQSLPMCIVIYTNKHI